MLYITACTTVGPDFVSPDITMPEKWSESDQHEQTSPTTESSQWWLAFQDPALNKLIELAWQQNNNLEISGLRVLEARAQLGIAQGLTFPQTQVMAGSSTYVSSANNAGGANRWQHGLGASASWEIDFWGKFKRGIESADAAYLASFEARNQVLLLLTAQVIDTYIIIRTNEALLRIAHENERLQQRSYDIANTLFQHGSSSELDVQQAKTLLLSTQATIPSYKVGIKKANNALTALLGMFPGTLTPLLHDTQTIPKFSGSLATGVPADLLRQRPDIRQAELTAMAQNARVGLAEADLYPSFSLSGSIGLAAAGLGGTAFGNLFSSNALTYSAGPSFVWPFLNYDRIKNNIRVQDARLQQALIAYRERVIQAAREVEDAFTSLHGIQEQVQILDKTVVSAQRSNTLSVLRYKEGFSNYQRVLDSQKSLFKQQQNLINQRGNEVRSLVSLYKALGGDWNTSSPLIHKSNSEAMAQRTNWGSLLDDQDTTKQ